MTDMTGDRHYSRAPITEALIALNMKLPDGTSQVPADEVEMWAFFEDLHTRKNEIFEACITDRTRELIQ